MKYYLIKVEENWADEADFYGFEIFNEDQVDLINKIIKAASDLGYGSDLGLGFGTNEYDEDEHNIEDYMIVKKSCEITETEYKTLHKLFGNQFGFTVLDQLLDDLTNEIREDNSNEPEAQQILSWLQQL